MASRPNSSVNIAVAAIDFGTTCTGYAYYLRKDKKKGSSLRSINTEQAWEGTSEMGLQAPTTVLFDKNGKFSYFGFEAETKYKSLTATNEHKGWYYFRYFKMKLHHERDLSHDMLMEDSEGKPFKSIRVFTAAIGYIKSHLMKKLQNALAFGVEEKDVMWVITVPAIWRDSAKQFMREAAKAAGIPNENLKLALEPESAAIFCKEQAINKADGMDGTFLSAFNPGQKYLVADLGGGTLDTTVHEVLPDGLLKELHAATGGAWGGQVVNEAFEDLIKDLVGNDVFRKFCTEKTNNWITLQKSFECRKREFTSHTETSDIDIPRGLADIYKDITGKELKNERLIHNIKIVGDGDILRLPPEVMKGLFAKATDKIVQHIEQLLKNKEIRGVSSILLVGGFSESQIVSKSIRDYFQKLKVIAPGSSSSAILLGAVMYGINDKIIASRISPYTYGIHTRRKFDKKIHPKKRMVQLEGRQVVNNAFCKQIEKGETVYVGRDTKGTSFTVINRNNPLVFWKVCQTDDVAPVFCDDTGCSCIGQLSVRIPEHITDTKIGMRVYMTCQGTELQATVSLPAHKITVDGTFNFLDKDYQYSGDSIED
ncbi:heat shock 70 kDa protein 12A-like [Mercenaria mercenaria]|uniref:heat shock 70 kDa protein 12A-like n=1 Tax=Mercenaria mercenaria TaxID=6596 RepID=UPI00234F59A5|nr:heat shock 70 kDa protein 12A-like [Mercenaria mercenaria]